MKKIRMVRCSALAAAVASALVSNAPESAQASWAGESPSRVVNGGRSVRERVDSRNLVLTCALEVRDATGFTVLSLPAGTNIGRERVETQFAIAGVAICQRTDLRDVLLPEETLVTDRSTGGTVVLPAGTMIRAKLDQRMDANGKIVRDRIDLRALKPDGTQLRIRDRAPEVEVIALAADARSELTASRWAAAR